MAKLRGASVAGLLAFLVCSSAVFAVSVKTVNVLELTRRAERVFRGRCLNAESYPGISPAIPVVEYTFVVEQAIKGVTEGETVVFRQVLSGQPGLPGIPGVPGYTVGEEMLLFLRRESRLGLTSPVGLGQGAFQIKRPAGGQATVLNDAGNGNLTNGLAEQDDEGTGMTREAYRELTRGRSLRLARFTSILDRIVRSQRPNRRNTP